MSPAGKPTLAYPEVFAAIGKFIAKKGISNVCIMEFENGVIVIGSALYETGEIFSRRTETHVLTNDDLKRLMKGG